MINPLQAAVSDILSASSEDPQSVVKQALAAIIEYAEDKDAFHSSRTVRNLEDAISHGESSASIARCRRAVDESSLDGIQAVLKDVWAEHAG